MKPKLILIDIIFYMINVYDAADWNNQILLNKKSDKVIPKKYSF
jgi:hypothetical protein